MLDVMHSGTFWHQYLLENLDLETVMRSLARPIQMWCYALLDNALGLPEPPENEELVSLDVIEYRHEKEHEDEDADEDELIDVAEDSDEEDPLASLRGALQPLDGSQASVSEAATSPPPSVSSK